jgi:hypothetical protein
MQNATFETGRTENCDSPDQFSIYFNDIWRDQRLPISAINNEQNLKSVPQIAMSEHALRWLDRKNPVFSISYFIMEEHMEWNYSNSAEVAYLDS